MTKYVWMKNRKTSVVKKVEAVLASDYLATGDWQKTEAPKVEKVEEKKKSSAK